jgi:hypothetical protein
MSADVVGWLRGRPWEAIVLPSDVRDAPTMISEEERALLYLLARDHATQGGAIIDAGCFLGGSTVALARGLADRATPPRGQRIDTYDLFIVIEGMRTLYGGMLDDLQAGDSLRPKFESVVGRHLDRVTVHRGDICGERWDGSPVELLFIDVAKDWAINDHVSREFFPALVPHHSVVVQQDFVHEWTPWLHITMALLEDAFTYVASVPYGSSVFVANRAIHAAEIPCDMKREIPDDVKLDLFDRSAARFEGEDRGLVECSRAYLLVLLDRLQDAVEHVDLIERSYPYPRVEVAVGAMRTGLATIGGRDAERPT